jgi:putative SOS response-associated peptidase YedK
MCGRFTLRARLNAILEEFALEQALHYLERYNIAPTQDVLVLNAERQLVWKRWGLIPSWAKDAKIGNSLINARADGVADKPSFRSAFKRGRCLVIADGFYEWRKDGKVKQPFFIHMKDDRPFAFAGLAEHWSKGEKPIDSCTIITTDPNSMMAPIHDRMPVILPKDAYDVWLDPGFQDKERLLALPLPVNENMLPLLEGQELGPPTPTRTVARYELRKVEGGWQYHFVESVSIKEFDLVAIWEAIKKQRSG